MKASLLCTGVASIWLTGVVASAQTAAPTVVSPAQVAVSQALRDGRDDSNPNDRKVRNHPPLPNRETAGGHDDALQDSDGPVPNATGGARFPGVGANGSAPPDTNMAVGPNHILQTVNSRYAIYNKAGALIAGPFSLSSLWSPLGSGNGCATQNGGDVVAQYDKLADRFLVTQLGGLSAPYSECIAVSQTSDPTGAYWLYSFSYGTTLNDYPKFGVWPTVTNSAYLATANLFANGQTFIGSQACAYDRSKMLVGDPTAQGICFTISNDGGYLPSDLDGSTPPLDGTPGYFFTYETLSSLRGYKLAPNFANPSASTFTVQTPDIAVASFGQACSPSFTCVPQSGTTQQLDSLGDRPMYRLAFRNFGDHEALVFNHSVTAGSSVGVRWYELRAPVSTSGAFILFQQGTFAPDSTYRWMGSAAMDASGDIAIGYSASSSSIHPSIRYTGRVPGDPLGTMETEVSLLVGTGSQTGGLSRWGDYSALRIDPSDDCTFWYTNEYLQSNGSFNWSTFFASFKFASCGGAATPDFSISSNPTSLTITPGSSGTSTISIAAINGFTGTVGLSVTGCPSGTTCSFSPASVSGAGSSTFTVATTSSTPTGGPITLTVTGTGPGGAPVHSTAVALTVNPAAVPDFSISRSPTSLTITRGSSGSSTVSIAAINGFTGTVGLSVTGCPSGTTCSFSPTSVTGAGSSTFTVSTTTSTPTGGPITLTVTGTGPGGAPVHSTTIALTVNPAAAPDFSISRNPTSLTITRGGSGTSTISITAINGFSGSVGLSVTGCPSATTCSFSPTSVTGAGSSTFTVSTTSSTPTGGPITLTVTGTGPGGAPVHSTTVALTVNAAQTGDFSISRNPRSLTLTRGASGTSTITVTALSGFSGTVGLTVAGCPSGATCSLQPTSVTTSTTASSTLTVSTNSGTSTGTFTLTTTGTSGSLTHRTRVTLTVNP